MKLRVARHTGNLERMIRFYHDIIGLERLGSFEGHNGYDGVFLGHAGAGWHLEFTVSDESPIRAAGEDDLLVLYVSTEAERQSIVERCRAEHVLITSAKNPYWNEHGFTCIDPDGYKVIIMTGKSF